LLLPLQPPILQATCSKGDVGMFKLSSLKSLRFACAAILLAFVCTPAVPAIKNMAVVTSAGSKLADVSLAELVKYCKGSAKVWPDGKSFVIVLKNPDLPEMRLALQKLFGGGASEARIAIAKLNESRQAAIIVESDDDLLHAVDTTPGAVGIIDVYSINSSVKVLRVDGKLPFDMGYALKGN
jgi:hypothetical protein